MHGLSNSKFVNALLVKVEVVHIHAMQAYGGNRNVTPLIINLGINPYPANVENKVSS